MTQSIFLGVWMDHSTAYLMEYSNEEMLTKTIKSRFTGELKEASIAKGEIGRLFKQKQLQSEYFQEIANVMRNYEAILLFGPTTAKMELMNMLKEDHHFDKIKIKVQQSFRMTENQRHAHVRDYFSKQYIY